MNTKLLGTTAAAALILSAVQAFAATIAIDTFDTNQLVSDRPTAGQSTSSTVTSANGDIIGGSRTLTATLSSTDAGEENATSLQVVNSFLSFSNQDGAQGSGSLFYNGNGAGLGNLQIGTNAFFNFDVRRFDNGGNVDITVNGTDTGGNMISFMENISSGNFSPNLFFTQFTGFESFDFTDVASLEFIVDTTNTIISIDGSLNAITLNADDTPPPAPVPLPASALLLAGGLGGLSVLRRRRKA